MIAGGSWLLVLATITSAIAVAFGRRRGIACLGAAMVVAVETIGAAVLFFVANVTIGIGLVLAARRLTPVYLTIYEIAGLAEAVHAETPDGRRRHFGEQLADGAAEATLYRMVLDGDDVAGAPCGCDKHLLVQRLDARGVLQSTRARSRHDQKCRTNGNTMSANASIKLRRRRG